MCSLKKEKIAKYDSVQYVNTVFTLDCLGKNTEVVLLFKLEVNVTIRLCMSLCSKK